MTFGTTPVRPFRKLYVTTRNLEFNTCLQQGCTNLLRQVAVANNFLR